MSDWLALQTPQQDDWAEWTQQNPPNDIWPLLDYYEWKTGSGWYCKMCKCDASRSHTGGKKHLGKVWYAQQEQQAQMAGYVAAGGGGGGGSWAAAAAAAPGNGSAGISGSGGSSGSAASPAIGVVAGGSGSGGSGGSAASPAIAVVQTQQQLDRIEAAIAKHCTETKTELEIIKEQLARLELSTVLFQ